MLLLIPYRYVTAKPSVTLAIGPAISDISIN